MANIRIVTHRSIKICNVNLIYVFVYFFKEKHMYNKILSGKVTYIIFLEADSMGMNFLLFAWVDCYFGNISAL